LVALVATMPVVVWVLPWVLALVMHVPCCLSLLPVVAWTAPRTGDTGRGGSGVGGTPAGETHQLSVQPGPGAMARSQDGYPGGSYSIGEAPVGVTHP
jgi:hypothetical protein